MLIFRSAAIRSVFKLLIAPFSFGQIVSDGKTRCSLYSLMFSKMTSPFKYEVIDSREKMMKVTKKENFITFFTTSFILVVLLTLKTVKASVINFNNQSNETLKISKQRLGGAITLSYSHLNKYMCYKIIA